MRKVWTMAMVALALTACATTWAGDAKKLDGTWKVTGVSFGGKDVSESIKGKEITMVFAGEKVTFKDGDKVEEGTVKIDASKKPMQINLSKGKDSKEDAPGIYTVEGDKLKIAIGFTLEKGKTATRPMTFEDQGIIVMTLTKQKDK